MAKISYSSLKLKKNTEVNKITYEDKEIEVLQYLSFKDKMDLIEITLQKSEENTFYNPLKIDMFFHLHLIYLYSNIQFTEKQREDEFKLYDTLQSSGLLAEIIKAIPEEEYDYLLTYLEEYIEEKEDFNRSFTGSLMTVVDTLPKRTEEAGALIKNFNPEDFKEVFNFVQSIGGPIPNIQSKDNLN